MPGARRRLAADRWRSNRGSARAGPVLGDHPRGPADPPEHVSRREVERTHATGMRAGGAIMNSIIYLIGLVVVVLAILSFLGLR